MNKEAYGTIADYYSDMIALLKMYDIRRDLLEELEDAETLVKSKADRQNAENAMVRHNVLIGKKEAEVDARTKASMQAGIRIPLLEMQQEFGLDHFDIIVLMRLIAVSIDPRFARKPDISDIIKLVCTSTEDLMKAREHFTTTAPLVARGLITMDTNLETDQQKFMHIDLDLPPSIVNRLLGDYSLKDRLQGFTELVEPKVDLNQVILPQAMIDEARSLVHNYAETIATREQWGFDELLPYGKGCIILFSGPPGTGKTMLAHALAKDIGKKLLSVQASHICEYGSINVHLFRNAFTEAKMHNALVFFDEVDDLLMRDTNTLLREFELIDDICIMATNKPIFITAAMERRILCHLRFRQPTPALRKRIWQGHIPPKAIVKQDINYDRLGTEFNLSGGYIKNAVLIGLNHAVKRGGEKCITHEDLEFGARSQIINAMRRDEDQEVRVPQTSIDEVMVKPATREVLDDIIQAGRNRSTLFQEWGFADKLSYGRSLTALFSGPSGTGKTMAAEAIAYELGMPLLVASLSSIISKYVGDTTKNLQGLFSRARQDNLILFFDEAEGLFAGRRGGMNANSYYINQDIDFLLTSMEQHDGIVLLASNNPEMLDEAFSRRIQYKVHFDKPGKKERAAIWKRHIPAAAPVEGAIDFAALAEKYAFTGGEIRNIVLRASYMALARGAGLSMALLEEAARKEKPLAEEKHIGFARHSA